ncbi:unnamed protein product [Schistosoma margrebowiei]|uniref:polynucleotide adenylyltransferase n=1 Tax=Schistosoma margrebowiei TaxID=48269 RepID=A0A183MQP9_9TREM|nr:unnamed protein product [Schistosoma margrebowiei]
MAQVGSLNNNSSLFNHHNLDHGNSNSLSKIFHLQLPELITSTQINRSAPSSACPSDDSGIERTLNLSPSSPFPEDTDSDDAQSFISFDVRRSASQLQMPHHPLKLGPCHFGSAVNYVESARLSPPGTCAAVVDDNYYPIASPKSNKPEVKSGNRFQILSYERVTKLHYVLSKTIPIHSRYPGFPTIMVKLHDLFREVRGNLKAAGIPIRNIRLNGGAASYIIGQEDYPVYNDIDVLISVDLSSNSSTFQKVKSAVLNALISFLPEDKIIEPFQQHNIPNGFSLRESYVYKQFRKFSQDDDCWSLLSLGFPSSDSKVIEFKFVDRMKRQFEFTVDSFQIVLDSLLTFYESNSGKSITPHFYPTIVAESVSGSFSEAFYHLENKLIATTEPEMIRGGGLLKYCRLLVSGYKPAEGVDVYTLERYMSSRFFIDFQDLSSQKVKLEAFLANHFAEHEISLKINYLRILYQVVSGSTICLMSHEHFQTLNLIGELLRYLMYYYCYYHFNRSSLSLEWFAEKQNLVLDKIYFGTQLFPVISRSESYSKNCFCFYKHNKSSTDLSMIPLNVAKFSSTNSNCNSTKIFSSTKSTFDTDNDPISDNILEEKTNELKLDLRTECNESSSTD